MAATKMSTARKCAGSREKECADAFVMGTSGRPVPAPVRLMRVRRLRDLAVTQAAFRGPLEESGGAAEGLADRLGRQLSLVLAVAGHLPFLAAGRQLGQRRF